MSAVSSAFALRGRDQEGLAERLALSAATREGTHRRTAEVVDWLDRQRSSDGFRVDRIPFAELDGWSFTEPGDDLAHRSGRFFTVEGLRVTVTGETGGREWHQPIIRQPEVGILGLLAKEFDGVLHFLMQAKMEPGNPNLVQLSPTVQATRSNYTKVHRGANVRYAEYFTRAGAGRVIVDVVQSEHGSWFFRKSNRNVIVEVFDEVPPHADFCWLTLGQIAELLQHDNTVNMDARTVLACVPYASGARRALMSDAELLSWFTGERHRHDVTAERVPLGSVPGWTRDAMSVHRPDGRYFKVVAVSVRADNREVGAWSQPLLEPASPGVVAFLAHEFGGLTHVLAHARTEGGFVHGSELGPTVQCAPGNYAHLPAPERPAYMADVLAAEPARIRYEAVHSEEGGRFLAAESRYLLVEADEELARRQPLPGYAWVTPGQLRSLVGHGHYLNVQARSLLACLNAADARETA